MSAMPPYAHDHYEHRACRVCGATTAEEASTMCKLSSDEAGEQNCRGGTEEENYPDGRLRFISPAGLAALDAWCDREMAKDTANA